MGTARCVEVHERFTQRAAHSFILCLQVQSVHVFQQRVNQFWEAYQEDLQKQVPGVTLDDFKWARALVSNINVVCLYKQCLESMHLPG
jgi:hypothetical protein